MTETGTMTLADFLLARIQEDAVAAVTATGHQWHVEGAPWCPSVEPGNITATVDQDSALSEEDAEFIARFDPHASSLSARRSGGSSRYINTSLAWK